MAHFFKDLFHTNSDFFEFDVLFGTSDIKIKENTYSYGQLVVELLNFDFTEFKQIMSENYTFEQKKKVALTLPVYRDFRYQDFTSLIKTSEEKEFLEMFSGNEIAEENFDKILESINFIEKYRWFLDEVYNKKLLTRNNEKVVFGCLCLNF